MLEAETHSEWHSDIFLKMLSFMQEMAMGQNPNRTPSEHPNPTTKIGSKMGGEFTYQPRWDPIGFDPQPSWFWGLSKNKTRNPLPFRRRQMLTSDIHPNSDIRNSTPPLRLRRKNSELQTLGSLLPFQLTRNLWGGTWKIHFLLKGAGPCQLPWEPCEC